MSQTRDQQRFTISEVAADWHEPMVPQRFVMLFIARANGQWSRGAASGHSIAQISHTMPLPLSLHTISYNSVPLRVGGRVEPVNFQLRVQCSCSTMHFRTRCASTCGWPG